MAGTVVGKTTELPFDFVPVVPPAAVPAAPAAVVAAEVVAAAGTKAEAEAEAEATDELGKVKSGCCFVSGVLNPSEAGCVAGAGAGAGIWSTTFGVANKPAKGSTKVGFVDSSAFGEDTGFVEWVPSAGALARRS